jgi:hypothetical protein
MRVFPRKNLRLSLQLRLGAEAEPTRARCNAIAVPGITPRRNLPVAAREPKRETVSGRQTMLKTFPFLALILSRRAFMRRT